MMTIWKYDIGLAGVSNIVMPVGAKPLCVGTTDGAYPVLWVRGDPDAGTEERRFCSYMTGQIVDADQDNYIGTVTVNDGVCPFVLHVYEVTK